MHTLCRPLAWYWWEVLHINMGHSGFVWNICTPPLSLQSSGSRAYISDKALMLVLYTTLTLLSFTNICGKKNNSGINSYKIDISIFN